ncbi:MAG: LytTR family DNA-binding domain-containing protein [Bacteroidales bacterium]|jgi:DNA-binding LytR/AlgR family response regulator|nr:LytTR family DNA-binding domain-containing protein [Bacteroidales bacterium]
MKYIVIDDEQMALDLISNYASKVSFLRASGKFRNAISALNFLQQNKVDLLFLDINMPDLTGIEMLNTLSQPPLVIFTTAYSEYALEGYKFHAIDYLLKPVGFEEFLKAVHHAYEIFQNQKQNKRKEVLTAQESPEILWVKSGTEYFKININEILYIKSEGNYVEFHLQERRIVTLDSLNHLINKLPEKLFSRIHKSYIVSLKHIDSFQRHQLRIMNKTFPIGSIYRESFIQKIKP